ncbi:MAG: hypothetical protein K2M07_04750 [Muribaculaceae bacterium]|nr:hypothetical protein [Muribaculaceae bacterium]
MRSILFLFAALTAIIPSVAGKRIMVIGSDDRQPVAGASVMASNGLIIGLTDADGHLDIDSRNWPLTIRSLGYESTQVDAECDTILLPPASYALTEVTVSPADRPITRVITFAREYCTGAETDTLQLYNEYMLEYFITDGKVKGYSKGDAKAHMKNVKRYGRIARSNSSDSIMRPGQDDEITMLSFIQLMADLPDEKISEPEPFRRGAKMINVSGKYSDKIIFRRTDNTFSVETDPLADHKDHRWEPWIFKMFGFTMDMRDFRTAQIFRRNEAGIYGVGDFLTGTTTFHVIGKGKLLKKIMGVKNEIDIYCLVEQYPVEIEHLTVEEYKEMKKEGKNRTIAFRKPSDLNPLLPSVAGLVDRIEEELPADTN